MGFPIKYVVLSVLRDNGGSRLTISQVQELVAKQMQKHHLLTAASGSGFRKIPSAEQVHEAIEDLKSEGLPVRMRKRSAFGLNAAPQLQTT